MNSVFSAFKSNKSDKQHKITSSTSSLLSGKKINNVTENSYENLRHIREIGSSSKIMSPIISDEINDELLLRNRNRPIIKPVTMLTDTDCFQEDTLSLSPGEEEIIKTDGALVTVDVVDHASIPGKMSSPENNCHHSLLCSKSGSNHSITSNGDFSTALNKNNCDKMLGSKIASSLTSISQTSSPSLPYSLSFSTSSSSPSSLSSSLNCTTISNNSVTNNCHSNTTTTNIANVSNGCRNTSNVLTSSSNESNNLPSPSSPSPRSRCSSSCSNTSSSTSCEVTTIAAVTGPVHSTSNANDGSNSTNSNINNATAVVNNHPSSLSPLSKQGEISQASSSSSVSQSLSPSSSVSSTSSLVSSSSSLTGISSSSSFLSTTTTNALAVVANSPINNDSNNETNESNTHNSCTTADCSRSNNSSNNTSTNGSHTQPIIMSKKRSNSNSSSSSSSSNSTSYNISGNPPLPMTTSSAAATPKNSRYSKPRLSISGLSSNNSMPSVHGRSSGNPSNGRGGVCGQNGQPKARLSTHQRNLSLDFRSMGILLPPVSQVTNTRINLTQHHRNRSLDSALQRIPEVEVSSPNAETENTFCTNSILGSTMCSKIVSSSASQSPSSSSAAVIESSSMVSSSSSSVNNPQNTLTNIPYSATTSNSNTINDKCIKTKVNNGILSSTEGNSTNTVKASDSKKREDLTSLGSDDSGIICGSESDQVSLNRIRQSHESLDSGEMDQEEECIEILETTSMDEEYRMLQSDLCFYQTPEKEFSTLKTRRKISNDHNVNDIERQLQQQQDSQREQKEQHTREKSRSYMKISLLKKPLTSVSSGNRICVPIDIDDKQQTKNSEQQDISTPTTSTEQGKTIESPSSAQCGSSSNSSNSKLQVRNECETKTEHIKNEILFKNFFGATKNAIFRTAQSIIENHEKKNAAKNNKNDVSTPDGSDVKSPTEISKKKEFFVLKSNSNKNKSSSMVVSMSSTSPSTAVVNTPETPVASSDFDSTTMNTSTPSSAGYDAGSSMMGTSSSSGSPSMSTTTVASPTVSVGVIPGNTSTTFATSKLLPKSSSTNSLNKLKVPGVVKCFVKETKESSNKLQTNKTERGPSGLLRFFESPIFNIHFAVHYLFYSKEPGVLSFIGNKIFSFPDQEVDLYIPQLIVMYIQMDELTEVLDPYLTYRCRKSVDFSLKCLWLLEAYNYQIDSLSSNMNSTKKTHLSLIKELHSKKERKHTKQSGAGNLTLPYTEGENEILSPIKKTHHRSQSDATVLLNDSRKFPSSGALTKLQAPGILMTPSKLCLGDLTSGKAFDNGCICFESVRGTVNDLLGHKTVCCCGAPKMAPQKEFMKALINIGKNLTSLQTKTEKTSALRIFLNLINKNLPARVWLPLHSDIPHHIVRITEEKTAVLNSKDKTPYIIYVEVVEVNDIYSSPVIMKMMPSLRHTKSEEHLDSKETCSSANKHSTSSSCCKEKVSSNGNNNAETTNCSKGSKISESSFNSENSITNSKSDLNDLQNFTEDDVWSQEDDEITAQYLNLHKICERDTISQMSLDSCDSRDQGIPTLFNIGDVRTRHCNNLNCENTKPFSHDPEDPSAAALKEPWHEKEKQIRDSSPYGHLSNWRLLSAIVKCGDDLRQELMATQLLQMFKLIWEEEHIDLWVRPYKIVCLSDDSGLIEPILNTVSLHQIKKNSNKSLADYFIDEYGNPTESKFKNAQKNFVQSCAAYCLISYLLQVKDRHNGNILLHSDGHLIHIDFGFILSISPKNLGFEQSPFKLTTEFVEVMGGTSSELWKEFNHLLLKGLMAARKHMDRIINLVEIMRSNAQLPCFKNGCSGTVQNLRKRFHMNLTEQELEKKVDQLVQDSIQSLSTKLYDGYQYLTNGIL